MSSDLRSRLGSTADIGETKRDADAALSKLVKLVPVEVIDIYTEPMFVKYDHEPKGVIAMRVRNDAALETPILCGSYCSFTWDGSKQRVRVDQIDGLAPGSGTKYRITFLMVG
jgi:hypothetical protein